MKKLNQIWLKVKELISPIYRVIEVVDLPQKIEPSTLYIAGEGPYRWFVALLCPCGCGEIIQLNVRDDSHPNWRIIERKGRVSLEPSIWRLKGCRSHFFFRNGRIKWNL